MTQGVKNDSGKLRMSLLPIEPLTEVLTILEFGAVKYAPDGQRERQASFSPRCLLPAFSDVV